MSSIVDRLADEVEGRGPLLRAIAPHAIETHRAVHIYMDMLGALDGLYRDATKWERDLLRQGRADIQSSFNRLCAAMDEYGALEHRAAADELLACYGMKVRRRANLQLARVTYDKVHFVPDAECELL